MSSKIQKDILRDFQVKKFCLYGFLKNLKFFEPYLIIYLMSKGINLFQLGILIAAREVIVNIFEIPSGFIADYFGRKKELYFCFGFYIASFVFFFLTNGFFLATCGMVFFGLGEAFRSGTHKAMIYSYLDEKGWQDEKTFVYGRTRSFSLIGSALSSLVGIFLILAVPSDSYIFLFSVVPYILDLFLIMSYPAFLDIADKKHEMTIKEMATALFQSFRLNINLRNLLVEEGMSEAAFSYVKDLIQPIIEAIIVTSGFVVITSVTVEDNLKIVLGLTYAILNIVGSYFSKKAYIIKGSRTSANCLFIAHIGYSALFLLLALFTKMYIIVFVLYLFIFILNNVRKPIFVDEIDNNIEKSSRATIISASAQLKSLFLMVFAPVLGFVADKTGFSLVMVILAIIFAITIPLLLRKSNG